MYGGSSFVSGDAADNDWHVHIATVNGASTEIATDGGTASSGSAGTSSFGATILIGGSSPNRLIGKMGDIVICNRTLTSGEKDDLLAYLEAKEPS